MGIVYQWVHVGRETLEATLARTDWTEEQFVAAAKERNLDPEFIVEAYAYDDSKPPTDLNGVLEGLVAIRSFDLDKALYVPCSIADEVPGAKALKTWCDPSKPVVKLVAPWKSTDIVGFEIVATAAEVRAVLPSLVGFRTRDDWRQYYLRQPRGFLSFLTGLSKLKHTWIDDDYAWNAWTKTLAALDSVAASDNDYLGISNG